MSTVHPADLRGSRGVGTTRTPAVPGPLERAVPVDEDDRSIPRSSRGEVMSVVSRPVALICAILWVGFVSAISFMESWLKFRAEGVTLPIGLGIGRLVFEALNRVEWVFAVAIVADLVRNRRGWPPKLLVLTPLAILILQTAWLLPALDDRAMLMIHGQNPGPSSLHLVYVAGEVLKVGALGMLGIRLFNARPVDG